MDRSQKALIYCRVSGKKQTKDGSGLDSQEYRCRQYAEAKGYSVEAVFPDDVSGGGDFIKRPGMVALLAYMDARSSDRFVVIFDDLKRYARDVEFHLKLRRIMNERGAVRECLNFNFEDTPEGKFNEIISAAAGELEREQMGRQNKQKAMARLEQGYAIRSVPPVGFKYVSAKGGGKILAHDEPIASIIREALEGFTTGRFASQSEIVRYLESQPDFPKDLPDGRIRQMTVKRMLTQILYGGYVAMPSWGISMREAKHEGIVSKETFWRIQDRLKERPVMPARKNMNEDFPLRGGVVSCACCGYALTGGWSTGKYKKYPYYFCHHQGCSERGKTIPVAKLHGRFEELLKSLQPSRQFLGMAKVMFTMAWDAQAARLSQAAETYGNKAHELEAEIGKVVDRMIEVSNPRALKAFEERIETLEREKLIALEKAAKKPTSLRPFDEMFELSMRFLANPYECWKMGGKAARNMVVRLAFDEPLQHTRESGCLNSKKSNVFRVLEGMTMSKRKMVPPERIELSTSPLPRVRSTPELWRPGVEGAEHATGIHAPQVHRLPVFADKFCRSV
tara:strand:+ start:37032 stop:38723 length:1692 start_codon:yes stop_codon:yes gene_type:complete